MTEAQTTFILSMYSKIRPLEGVCVFTSQHFGGGIIPI